MGIHDGRTNLWRAIPPKESIEIIGPIPFDEWNEEVELRVTVRCCDNPEGESPMTFHSNSIVVGVEDAQLPEN